MLVTSVRFKWFKSFLEKLAIHVLCGMPWSQTDKNNVEVGKLIISAITETVRCQDAYRARLPPLQEQ